jgi:hypothetical protein
MLNVVALSVIMLNVVTLSVIMLNVVTLSVIMLNVVMLSVVAPSIVLGNPLPDRPRVCTIKHDLFAMCREWTGFVSR